MEDNEYEREHHLENHNQNQNINEDHNVDDREIEWERENDFNDSQSYQSDDDFNNYERVFDNNVFQDDEYEVKINNIRWIVLPFSCTVRLY